MNVRAEAAFILKNVINEKSALTIPSVFEEERDQALLQTLCYGVCRWYFQLNDIANQLLKKPLKEKDQDVYALILIGLYQLIHLRTPEHAAISETVSASAILKKPWAKGLVNAILREYQRHPVKALSEEGEYSHPAWLIEKIKMAYPESWKAILIANNQHPPFSLRVNEKCLTRESYLQKLQVAGFSANPIPHTSSGIMLEKPVKVTRLPGFKEGEISVQDGAAQLTVSLLQLEAGLKVLDACAAPGGKATHILEKEPEVHLLAIDEDSVRLERVEENLKRLKLSAVCMKADASHATKWWDKTLFDRILLDAPCSATGVIRRHPDIKLTRRASDIAALAEKQLLLLNNLWTILKPGGLLLYVTCSILPEENSEVLESFLKCHPDAREEKIESSWGIAVSLGKQILPGADGMDGFYYAVFKKMH